ncbi:phage late control D family protein [Natronobiforma cellulositropha]|uniref:phage late control D family protein n=1 Tax=Natronobiforma cellulositropha TaxID=1679076 RepID=UPI0021D59F87|nr:hypothetical protein [Natronobiforma cellulositropha]
MSSYSASYVPRFLVTVDGEEFHEYSGYVSDVIVDTAVDGANHFSVTLTYPYDHEHVSFEDLDWDQFEPGADVEISMGYGDSGAKLDTLFVGTIYTVQPTFPTEGSPTVKVSGYGPLHEMMQGTNSESWTEPTLKTVVQDAADPYFSTVEIEKADMELGRIIQDNKSDYRFVRDLASKYGFEVFSTLDTLTFRPNDGTRDDPVATLFYGETLESFTAELNDTDSVAEVEVRHWDLQKKEAIVGSATVDSRGSKKRVYRIPVESESEATKIAKAKATQTTITGSGETFGVPEIVAGEVVELDGLGPKFTKDYYVTKAIHRMGSTGYRTFFEVTGSE